jgi:ATP-dependent DNA helicase HFM1/MER3
MKLQYMTDQALVFQHIKRLIRCIIDCQLGLQDPVALRNALMLCRSLSARCWDDSPLQLRQLEGIGPAAVRKLVNAGIRTMEELDSTEAHKIESALGRNPPFGMNLLKMLKHFPKLRVSMHIVGQPVVNAGQGSTVHVKAEIGFMNVPTPMTFRGKPVYVVFLAETSDGTNITFGRLSAKKIGNGQEVKFTVQLTSPAQSIICHVMCDEFAGTMRTASLKPTIPSIAWLVEKQAVESAPGAAPTTASHRPPVEKADVDTARKRNHSNESPTTALTTRHGVPTDEFGDNDLEDDDLMRAASAGGLEFQHIDSFLDEHASTTRKNTAHNQHSSKPVEHQEPKKLENSKWACNHSCKDKNACKHLCCREGLDKPPKPSKKHSTNAYSTQAGPQKRKDLSRLIKGQTQLHLTTNKKDKTGVGQGAAVSQVDLTHDSLKGKSRALSRQRQGLRTLEKLHSAIQKDRHATVLHSTTRSNESASASRSHPVPGLHQAKTPGAQATSDYGDIWPENILSADLEDKDLPKRMDLPVELSTDEPLQSGGELTIEPSEDFGGHDDALEEAMIGLADSQDLRTGNRKAIEDKQKEWGEAVQQPIFEDRVEPWDQPAPAEGAQKTACNKPIFPSSSPSLPDLTRLPKFRPKAKPAFLFGFSSSSSHFSKNSSPLRKRGRGTGAVKEESPAPAKKRKVVLGPGDQNDPPTARNTSVERVTEPVPVADADPKECSKEDIDPMIWEEFGKWVDFV